MTRFFRQLPSASFLLFSVLAQPLHLKAQAPDTQPQDTAAVQHVIDSYHEAVLAHDGSRLASLFIPEGGAWMNVLSDDAYARAKAKSPNAIKVRVGSYKDFAKFVTSTKADLNPTHTNLVIHTDGTIATVYFNFVFLSDGKPTNRGSESWELVKGADGWRIAAIIYSSNPANL